MDIPGWVEKNIGPRMISMHDKIYQKTEGRIGHKVPGMPPSLLLHTTGAKTGQPRTNSLTYARDGDSYLIVASNGGANRNPSWYHNLRSRPNAEINLGPKRSGVTWRTVMPDDSDYARLWDVVNKNNANRYEAYQHMTTRPIAIVALTATG